MEHASDDDLDAKLVAALERVGTALRAHARAVAGGAGISVLQAQVLDRLARAAHVSPTVTALTAELDVTQPTISEALTALVQKGYVERLRARHDRRSVHLRLSRSGRELVRGLAAAEDQLAGIAADLDPERKATTLQTLLDLIAGLQREGLLTVARTCVSCRFFARDTHEGSAIPHHCLLLDQPLHPAALRVDCPEHEPALAGP